MEQYKSYLQDLGNIGTRRDVSNRFYLTILTVLIGGLFYIYKDKSDDLDHHLAKLLLPFLGLVICVIWYWTLLVYRKIFKHKFTVLSEMEKAQGIHHAFESEKQHSKDWLFEHEDILPIIMAVLFLIIYSIEYFHDIIHIFLTINQYIQIPIPECITSKLMNINL